MISKPIGMSPDNETISFGQNKTLSVSCYLQSSNTVEVFTDENGIERAFATLVFSDGQYIYNFTFNDAINSLYAPILEYGESEIKVDFTLPSDKIKGTYMYITNGLIYQRGIKLSKLLTMGKTFSYKIRLYEKRSIVMDEKYKDVNPYKTFNIPYNPDYVPNNIVGYGTINEKDKFLIDNKKPNKPITIDGTTSYYQCSNYFGYRFDIFPHQNVYDNILTFPYQDKYDDTYGYQYYTQGSSNGQRTYVYLNKDSTTVTLNEIPSLAQIVYNIMKYMDKNIKYYFVINGYAHLIYRYAYYSVTYKTGYTKDGVTYTGNGLDWIDGHEDEPRGNITNFDSYGNPLHAWAYVYSPFINKNDTYTDYLEYYNIPYDKAYAIWDSKNGDTYQIRTNFIESNWGYFNIYERPSITVTDMFNNTLSNSSSFDNPINLAYSSLKLNVLFEQSQGIEANSFSYKIFKYDSKTDDFILDYYSGNRYNQRMQCEYSKFFNNTIYKILITLTDTADNVYERVFYFKTNYSHQSFALYVNAQYYHPHNSIVVDWSKINSITPDKKTGDVIYKHITDTDDGYTVEDTGKKSAFLPSETCLEYGTNDFGDLLHFKEASIAVDFYGTDYTSGNVFDLNCDDGFNVSVQYIDKRYLYVYTSNYSYRFDLYSGTTIDDLKAELLRTTVNRPSAAPFVWNNDLEWNSNYTWKIYNNISAKWRLVITPHNCNLIGLSSYCTVPVKEEVSRILGVCGVSRLKIYGNIILDKLTIVNKSDFNTLSSLSDTNIEWAWTEQSQFLSDFNGHVNGINSDGDFRNVKGYRIYKAIGDGTELYEVGDTVVQGSPQSRILEDFAIGDNCNYKYYVYAVVEKEILDDSGSLIATADIISTPMTSNDVFIREGVDKVFGLKEISNKTYEPCTDEIWRIALNLSDTGYTLKTDKTFYDTFNQYSQEIGGNRRYITKPVKGMLGTINCKGNREIQDNYDMLVSWNNFSSSSHLKCFVDTRGLILPGNFEADPSVEYMEVPEAFAIASFNWRQKSDLNIIKIYGRLLDFNPLDNNVILVSAEGYYLTSENNDILLGNI